jgi:hypothetical protein
VNAARSVSICPTFCTSKTSKVRTPIRPVVVASGVQRQYLYFSTSKTSKVRTPTRPVVVASGAQRQYLYFCTSKASKVRTPIRPVVVASGIRALQPLVDPIPYKPSLSSGTQFTCFTSTKAQILTQRRLILWSTQSAKKEKTLPEVWYSVYLLCCASLVLKYSSKAISQRLYPI